MNDSKKKVAIFLPTLGGGGAERVMLNLAKGFAGQGYTVDLVLAQAEGPYLTDVPVTVRLVELNAKHHKAMRTLASLPALVSYLRNEQPDALLSALHSNLVALWARRFVGFPQQMVITEHSTFACQNQRLPKWFSRIILKLMRFFYPWANGIVAVSEGVADDLSQVTGIPRDRIQVIYNPVVTPDIQIKVNEPFEHPWFGPGEPPVLLSVGSLTAIKDFGTMIQAFAKVRKSRPIKLLILGEGDKRSELEALVKHLRIERDVSLPGFISNPYPYMAKASLFVLSSKLEGLPTVLIEAMSLGASVIATNCPSGPGEILRNGKYGRLVSVGDVAGLSKAIDEMLDQPKPDPSPESWQPFELENVVNQYKSILSGI